MQRTIAIVLGLSVVTGAFLLASTAFAGGGFDEYGYNDTASNFVGTCLSWYEGKYGPGGEAYCGPYVNDKLKMTWNAEWNRGNAESWLNPPYDAWEDNQWNGMIPGGSGETWHYMIKWVGTPCDDTNTNWADGGYCIWGQFEMLSSHGTVDGTHIWDRHSLPTGYGVPIG